MPHVTVHVAKTQLSRLIERALAGEDVIISRGKLPVVRIVPINEPPVGRKFGALKGRATVTDAFFEPLPASELDAWDQ
jgi:prevent-host-death family protein